MPRRRTRAGHAQRGRAGGLQIPPVGHPSATRVAGEAATRFKALTLRRAASGPSTLAAAALHTAWGTAFDQPQAKGIRATHSVLVNRGTTTRGGEYIYSPTSLSPGGACMEITTAYTPSGPLLWAWDWCGGRSRVGKAVTMNSAFLGTYTTTVNGLPAYSFEVSQTNAASNAWIAYLYNFQTHAFETSYGNPPPSGSSFQCPRLTFAMNSPNNHWSARISG